MEQLLKLFLKRLVQLDAGNRSLYLPKLSKEKDLDLHEFDFATSKPSFHIIEKLVTGKSVVLCSVTDARDSTSNLLSARLKKIIRKEKSITEETGAKDLYVGYPFVHGMAPGGLPIRCPLLFFPVSLELHDNQWLLVPQTEESVNINKSLLLAYAHFFQTKYDDELAEIDGWELGSDALSFRTALYELLKKSSLEINFNQELFQDKLRTFTEYPKRESFGDEHTEGILKLFPEAVLGIFPQAGSYLEPDYQWLLENKTSDSLENFFEEHQSLPTESLTSTGIQPNSYIHLIKEEQTFTPFKIDIFQENAIKAVKHGHSLVVQGPPGTGKSQLICNLAADFMARGKNVLIVCQKRAALDVVKKRLSDGGIGDFVSLVHDFNHDRKSIFSKIDAQIANLELYKEQNYQLDTVFLERNFQQASRRIDQLNEELELFRKALFDSSVCGISPNELYNTCSPSLPSIPILEFKKFHFSTWEEMKRKIDAYARYHQLFGKEDYIWKDRVSFANFTWNDKKRIEQLVPEIGATGTDLVEKLSKKVNKKVTVDDLDTLKNHLSIIQEIILGLSFPIRKQYVYLTPNPRLSKKKVDTLVDLWASNHKNGLKTIESEREVDGLISVLEAYHTAQKKIFSRLQWNLFSPEKKRLNDLCLNEGLPQFSKSKSELESRIRFSKALHEQTKHIKSQPWGAHFPNNPIELTNWSSELIQAISLKEKIQKWTTDYPLFQEIFKHPDAQHKLEILIQLEKDWNECLQNWQLYIPVNQIKTIISKTDTITQFLDTLNKDFDFLCEFDQLIGSLLPFEKSTLETLVSAESTDHLALFDNSIRLAWLHHLEEQTPLLRMVSTFRMEDLTNELQEKIKEKQQLSQHIVQQKVKERVYRNTSFNRLNNRVTYRELQHQVTKKKKIWPLRKVLGEFHEEVFNLMPCWLASPESVSAIFPMAQWFDLVIFDEASQCFAEKGLPAMFRAKQIVVTGDSQQLQPNDLYQVRWDDPEDESFESGVDSLLDLCSRYLPQVQLSEHYRSKNPSLIDFSNEHFYKNTLRLVPYERVHREKEPAITFIHAGGLWENNSNQIEAEKVVKLTLDLIRENPEKELGIVTFNFRQQNLIQDLLEQESILQKITLPDTLIVKNIENIQGDEKDIILFSIGYAPDLKGKLVMNFGSLNAEGGQNRLNVAITRAKEKVYVLASLLPQQLHVDDAKHEGPRLLKKYLTYAMHLSGNQTIEPIMSPKKSLGLGQKISVHLDEKSKKKPVLGLDFADLALPKAKETLLLLTDDNRYYSALSSKDLHGYFLLRLHEKEWKYKQIFSRNFWANFEDSIQKLDLPN